MRFELTTLVLIGTDCIGVIPITIPSPPRRPMDTIKNPNTTVYDKGVDEHCLDAYSLNICGEWYLFLSVKVIATINVSMVTTETESNRICGIELIFPGESSIIFLSVYLPAVTQSYEMFHVKSNTILTFIMNTPIMSTNVFILGDFTSGPQKLK